MRAGSVGQVCPWAKCGMLPMVVVCVCSQVYRWQKREVVEYLQRCVLPCIAVMATITTTKKEMKAVACRQECMVKWQMR